MHAACEEDISGSSRGGMEGVEGGLVASALGWGSVVLLGFALTKVNACNLEFTASDPYRLKNSFFPQFASTVPRLPDQGLTRPLPK
eukprot:1154984-Pelagomonas_calceolata.AAC.1